MNRLLFILYPCEFMKNVDLVLRHGFSSYEKFKYMMKKMDVDHFVDYVNDMIGERYTRLLLRSIPMHN